MVVAAAGNINPYFKMYETAHNQPGNTNAVAYSTWPYRGSVIEGDMPVAAVRIPRGKYLQIW